MIHSDAHGVTVHHGDCLDVLRADENGYRFEFGYGTRRLVPDCSVDSVVTDPPYGLEFMGKEWDSFGRQDVRQRGDASFTAGDRRHGLVRHGVGGSYGGDTAKAMRAFQQWCELWAAECLRVLRPGGHMLAFGGTRTWHRLACAVEDAGFEIRDSIAWLQGAGFPKALNVGRAIDRHLCGLAGTHVDSRDHACPVTPQGEERRGHATALKPAFEPVVVARKPLTGTVASTVLAHGTGALNIDACRIATADNLNGGAYKKEQPCSPASTATTPRPTTSASASDIPTPSPDGPDSTRRATGRHDGWESWRYVEGGAGEYAPPAGRWPPNVVLDESQAAALDLMSGESAAGTGHSTARKSGDGSWRRDDGGMHDPNREHTFARFGDIGGASRFMYVAKADASERPRVNGISHATVKPLALMRWLVRLVTPPGGTVLEPFAGSGTTVEACIVEGFRCIAIEREAEYLPLIEARISRRRDPVRAIQLAAEDLGLFGIEEVS